MARTVTGPLLTGVVRSTTGGPLAGVTVTPSVTVYTDRELTAGVATLTTDGVGVFAGYAKPGVYTFTCDAPSAPIEDIEVLSPDLGTTPAGAGGAGGGAVDSVFGRTGVVTAHTGDYTAVQVGADASGAAAAAQSAAATDATSKANTAQSNAETYADTGDALAAKKAANLSDLASASTARTSLGLGTAATQAVVAAGSSGVLDASDPTTTNARTPTAHHTSHASAGSDPVTLAESQITNLTTDLAGKQPLATGGTKAAIPATGTGSLVFYVATDENGGTLYQDRTNGAAYTKVAAGATENAGQELAYAEITANATTTATGLANRVDVSGLLISVTVTTRPIMLEFFGSVANTTVNDGAQISLINAASGDTNRLPLLQNSQMLSAGIASAIFPFSLRVRLNPTAGTYSYKVQINATVGGTATIFASSTQPAFIRAMAG